MVKQQNPQQKRLLQSPRLNQQELEFTMKIHYIIY